LNAYYAILDSTLQRSC